jgi:hypothetical protein
MALWQLDIVGGAFLADGTEGRRLTTCPCFRRVTDAGKGFTPR